MDSNPWLDIQPIDTRKVLRPCPSPSSPKTSSSINGRKWLTSMKSSPSPSPSSSSRSIRARKPMRHSSFGASREDLKSFYVSEIGLFMPNMAVNNETLSGDVIMFHGFRVFRNVRLFIQQVKCIGSRDGISLPWVIDFCLQGGALGWFNSLPSKESLKTGPLRPFYEHLMSEFDRDTRVEEARIAKEKAEAFACGRCPCKFPSNTKLHQHVQEKHSRKPKEPTSIEKPSPPASPPPAPIAPASPVAIPSAPATPTTTPQKPISWTEVASRPKKPTTPSRIPLPTALPTPPPTPLPSPVISPQKLTNRITKLATPMKHLTVQDLYRMFHGKPRPMSLPARQIRLPSAPPSGQMRLRQMRITTYFQPTNERPASEPKAKLAPNRKHADSRAPAKSAWNRDLALTRPYTTQGRSFSNSACRLSCHHLDHSPTHGRKHFVVGPQHRRKHGIV